METCENCYFKMLLMSTIVFLFLSEIKKKTPGLQIFFKICGPEWPMEQKRVGNFLKWWAQAYKTNHSWHLGCILCQHLYAYMYIDCWLYSISGHSKRKTNYRLMQVKSIAECSAILSTFIKLPFVIKIFVLSFLSGCLRHVLLYWWSTYVCFVEFEDSL